MYINNEERKAKIGKISVSVSRDNSIKLRFTYPKGKRHDINVATDTEEGWVNALRIAQAINADIELGQFDNTLAKYSPKRSQALEINLKEPNIKKIWERYKELNKSRIAATTQNYLWKDCDRYLSKTDMNLLELNNAQEFISYLQGKYAISTIATLFRSCLNPAVNTAVNAGIISTNPFKSISIPKPQRKPIECFEPSEVKAIIAAFYSDEYNHKFSSYQHSYYAQYIEVLALTGARPEEIIALTFDDIKRKGEKTYIKFSKAYSKGVLLPHTKTKEIRLFPCNRQLLSVLGSIEIKSNLIFPGVEGGYLNHGNFRKRDWRVVLEALVKDEKMEKYLKPYALRHSFITRLVREGVDIKTVAILSGNSVATIIKHYLAAKQDFNLPEL
ncbi:tyrosine-type recombinase/integrase [Myxosarcina sp. GI1(2024)]